ncbi:MAG: hypothetical protein LBI20_01260 [Holosporales bacterium]|jgi:exonuclease VII small subunit|nr:hypothetical protein [Holosporales bacterium]
MMRWHIAKVAEQHKEIVALRKEQKRKDVAHQEFVARSDQERHRLNQLIHDLSGRAAHFEAVAADLTRREACVGQQYTALNVGYATLRQQYEEITRRLAAVQLQYDEARRRYEECMARNQTLHARLNQAHAELDQARGIPPYPRAPSSLSQYG